MSKYDNIQYSELLYMLILHIPIEHWILSLTTIINSPP